MSEYDTICQVVDCDRPSDGWIVCKNCGDHLAKRLHDMGWMIDELETVITQQTRYASQASGRAAETAMVFNVKASEAHAKLVSAMTTAARMLAEDNGFTLTIMGGKGTGHWLLDHVRTLRLHVAGGDMHREIMTAWDEAIHVIDRPKQRQYLGHCIDDINDQPCGGLIYGRQGKAEARCNTCGGEYDAQELRAWLMKELEQRLLTAAEIARLASYLGVYADPKDAQAKIRKRVNAWHTRHRISAKGDRNGAPVFLCADVLPLLYAEQRRDEQRTGKTA